MRTAKQLGQMALGTTLPFATVKLAQALRQLSHPDFMR